MVNYFKTVLGLLISFNLVNSCSSNHSNRMNSPSIECIKFNNDGVVHLSNYPVDGEKGLNEAIQLFKQAIKCDSMYYNAYINLTNAYDQKGNYSEEMIAFNKLLIITNNDPSILFMKGMLFERMQYIDSAKQIYFLTRAAYAKKLTKYPDDINAIRGIILLKAVTDGKDEAIKELNKQIKIHPKLSSKLGEEHGFYEEFDRHAFIYRLPGEG
jgi:tetratricopeptide (TPR) repeat protein